MFNTDNINSFDPSTVKDEAFLKAWNHFQEVLRDKKKRPFEKASPKQKVKQLREFKEFSKFNNTKVWRKGGVTGWQYATQITTRARFGANPETKAINNWT
jgi:hypothetical protein|tara:strand:+ start:97 stop:396 length:300 start_codon:yes stop_codon:yes gene_type:complete